MTARGAILVPSLSGGDEGAHATMVEVQRIMNSPRHFRDRRGLVALSVGLFVCLLGCQLRAATPLAKDFPSLEEAVRRLDGPVLGDTVAASIGSKTIGIDPEGAPGRTSAESPILAFEENAHFLCAVADLSRLLPPAPNA